MRNIPVHTEFDLFGIDQDQLDLLRRCLVEDTQNDAVDAHRLTGAGGTGDQQVGHLVDIEYDGTPGHLTAEAGGDAALGIPEFRRLQQVAQVNDGGIVVRHLDTDRRFAGDGRLDAHARLGKVHGNVVYQIGNGTHTHTCLRFDLIPRDGRSAGAGHTLDADLEALQRILQDLRVFLYLAVIRLKAGRALGQDIKGWEHILGRVGGCVAGGRDLLVRQPLHRIVRRTGQGGGFGRQYRNMHGILSVGPDHPSACGCPLVARDLGQSRQRIVR